MQLYSYVFLFIPSYINSVCKHMCIYIYIYAIFVVLAKQDMLVVQGI